MTIGYFLQLKKRIDHDFRCFNMITIRSTLQKSVKKWLADNEIDVLKWPAQSPDLNPKIISGGKWKISSADASSRRRMSSMPL